MNNYWSKVFMRLLRNRYKNSTFQAYYPSVQTKFEYWGGKNVLNTIDYCVENENAAFDFFESFFSNLSHEEQFRLTGFERGAWLEMERQERGLTN